VALAVVTAVALVACGQATAADGRAAAPGPATISAAAKGHPRLLIRASDVKRVRSWASSRNQVYTAGLRRLALTARAHGRRNRPA